LHFIDPTQFTDSLNVVRKMAPQVILRSHLPVAQGMNDDLLCYLESALTAHPFVGPDQPALEATLRQLTAR
jgi:hypothetical protein